jgi:type I restriction-modification system DNA methylase subunit
MLDSKLDLLQERLYVLESKKDMDSAKNAVRAVVGLLIPNSDDLDFKLFRDGDGKLTANASWFFHDEEIADRRATYTFDVPSDYNLDIKVFGVAKPNMRTISWVVGLTPNFEDEPFNGVFNVGIDFVIPESKDRIIVALSKNYVVRTIELKGNLTATFLDIFASWLKIRDTTRKAELHTLLWDSLDLHPINKRFYEGISQRFIALRQHLEASGILDSHHASQFSNRLIGRIIFTWFLDKKGLLDQESEYFSSEDFSDDTDFYKTRLESLFFEVLNTPVSDRTVLDLKTPYLNGGLFEPKPEDLFKSDLLTFPRNYFDDLFLFLRGYNFTTDESTSDFQQVAIDPEMLGRIFENLLAEVSEETGDQARKAKGAFYTPREIVDYMCRESLKTYLRSKIKSDDFLEARIYQLVDATERQFQDQDHNWRRDLKPYKDEIIKSLDSLKVLDPACGSGAFPIGMMQLLVRVYARLEPRFDHHKAKLSIIEKNIFGVDIEPMAVEISRLRAWLALVVDEEVDSKSVKPLPNLDFKFVPANSLIPLEPQGQLSFFEDEDLGSKLQEIREAYFNTENLKQKAKLKSTYQSIVDQELTLFGESKRTSQLKSFRPFDVDSVADFFDATQMFGFEAFDIVIGNPPYVRQEKIWYKKELSSYKIFQSTADLYTYFYELALRNVGDNGIISFITSSKFGRALYGEKLRKLLAETTTIDLIVDYGTSHVFSAITNTWVLQARKQIAESGHHFEVKPSISESGTQIQQNQLGSSSWAFLDGDTDAVVSKIKASSQSLKTLGYKIYQGLKTGCNEAYVIDEATKNHLVGLDPKNLEVLKPLLRGRDIGHFEIRPITTWIIATRQGIDVEKQYPTIAEFLKDKNKELEGRVASRGDQGAHWMNLRDCTYYGEMESTKVIWLELSDRNKFAYSTDGEYLLNSAWMVLGPNLKALLAVLNSTLILYYFKFFANSSGMGTTQWRKYAVEELPIPDFDLVDQKDLQKLESLVDQRNKLTQLNSKVETQSLENEIDQIVYSIYGLSETDVEHIKAGV